MKKLNWKVVDKIEDSGKGYDRIFVEGKLVATVENNFVKMGDKVALKCRRVYVAGK